MLNLKTHGKLILFTLHLTIFFVNVSAVIHKFEISESKNNTPIIDRFDASRSYKDFEMFGCRKWCDSLEVSDYQKENIIYNRCKNLAEIVRILRGEARHTKLFFVAQPNYFLNSKEPICPEPNRCICVFPKMDIMTID